jgi:hypothetical protein
LCVFENHAKKMNTTKLHASAVLYLDKAQRYTLDRRLDGLKNWFDVKYRIPISVLQSHGLVTTATDWPVLVI